MFVAQLVPTNQRLAKWGNETLFILIYHAFAWRMIGILVEKGMPPYNEPMALVYAVVVIFVVLLLSKVKILKWILNPVTFKRR